MNSNCQKHFIQNCVTQPHIKFGRVLKFGITLLERNTLSVPLSFFRYDALAARERRVLKKNRFRKHSIKHLVLLRQSYQEEQLIL